MLISSKVIANSGVEFGTSGARGLVSQFTPDVCAAFTHSFVKVMQQSFTFDWVAIAIDNRPSSAGMAMSCAKALQQLGVPVVYYGVVPTPALAFTNILESIPAIMVTGSHIPFDRNGLKFYRPDGEISKADEQAILQESAEFDEIAELPELSVNTRAAETYLQRYTSLFDQPWLVGKRIGIYEHSSAGRDLYARLFTQLGAEVISLERSDQFVPVDTEAVSDEDKAKAVRWSKEHNLDAIFSTDGDGDRPLIADEQGQWLRGDILGLLCSKALHIEALAVPVSCNTSIESCGYFTHVSRTRIGSPYVIAEFSNLTEKYKAIAGFEANGGFLLGSDVEVNGHPLKALPTRDAVLPVLMLLLAASGGSSIADMVKALPPRFTHSDRIKDFATERSQAIITRAKANPDELLKQLGFGDAALVATDNTDGLRMTLKDHRIIHLRPSGNAPELRCYAEADSADAAKYCVDTVLQNVQAIKIKKGA